MSHWWPKLRPCIKCGLLRMGLAGGKCEECRAALDKEQCEHEWGEYNRGVNAIEYRCQKCPELKFVARDKEQT